MKRALVVAAAALSVAAPAFADKRPEFVKTKSIGDKPTVQLDPTQGHILLRSSRQMPLYLMRMPSVEDQAAYDALRAEAFAEARGKYAKKLASYEAARKAAAPGQGGSAPDKPVEPTAANFEFTPFGMMAPVSIGPLNRFAKGEGGASTYLQAVTPGRYRVYGPIMPGANGAIVGACYCMGSVSFEAKAGEVVDVSVLAELDGEATPDGAPLFVGERKPGATPPPVDPRLAGMTVRPARFRPVGKIPNYFGLAITRLPAMPGVMRYDRDRVVDLTADAGAGAGVQ